MSSQLQFIVSSPLLEFSTIRPKILSEVASRTEQEFAGAQLDLVLGEALYSERLRIKRLRDNIFTRPRTKKDRALWNQIQAGLLRSAGESDRKVLLRNVLEHYTDEIGKTFDPRVFRFATQAIPWFFRWLLNAASVKQFAPWSLEKSLSTKLILRGEIEQLQRLAQRGTILLVPTHQSNIDSILIGYYIHLMSLPPFSYGAGLNLFTNPVLSFFMSNLGVYTVDRRKSNLIYKQTLKNYSTRILREGIHSIFFPGGGRSRSGAIESKVKLGLLGTALDAQIENTLIGHPKPSVFVVPMVMSYHFVLEAGSLIEDYLAEAGKHRYIITDDESFQPWKVANFFWKFFASDTQFEVRIGKAMDVFGNLVDEEGRSMGPNGTTIDPKRWFTTRGEVCREPERDREYTKELGARIVERYYRENTVLTSHLVAFALFELLRKHYPELDLYRFLRLSFAQRSLPYAEFVAEAERLHARLREMADRGEVHLSDEFTGTDTETWIRSGVRQLGLLHDAAVVKVDGRNVVFTEDMNLLYYYRNRLAGYGISVLAGTIPGQSKMGQHDKKGFLV